MDADYDSPWKEALDCWFEQFVEFFFPHIHREIDWSRGYETLDKELQQVTQDAELGRRHADKLVRVWLLDGTEEWLLIHIEVQGQREPEFERRVFVYNYRIFDKYNRTVVSLAVLTDDDPNWRPSTFAYGRWGSETRLRFPSVKLLDHATDETTLAASTSPFAVIVLAHLKTMETRKDETQRHYWKTQLVRNLYSRGLRPDDMRQLFRLIDWMMRLPPELERLFRDELERIEEAQRMPYVTSIERLGREDGCREERKIAIRLLLELRFGADGLALLSEIQPITDLDTLLKIRDAIKTAPNVDEIRKVWQSGPTDSAS